MKFPELGINVKFHPTVHWNFFLINFKVGKRIQGFFPIILSELYLQNLWFSFHIVYRYDASFSERNLIHHQIPTSELDQWSSSHIWVLLILLPHRWVWKEANIGMVILCYFSADGDIRSRCLRLSDQSTSEALAIQSLLGHQLPFDPRSQIGRVILCYHGGAFSFLFCGLK